VPGKSAVELFQALKEGSIKAVWIACTNPAQSMPEQQLIHDALRTAELVVVQEAFAHTETCAFADVLLPATTWGEKDGTVTNSERRITRVRPAVAAPGEARNDWDIATDFAKRLGTRLGKAELAERLFAYDSPEAIWNEHRESTRGRDLDITGLSYARLENDGPQQWPFPEGASGGAIRLYTDGVYPTASGRARFVATEYVQTAEKPSARYPLHLLTGRLRDQWHGMSRTGLVARLYNHEAEPLVHMHPDDLARRHLKDGDIVRIKSRQGSVLVKTLATDTVRAGQCFLPMHWGGNAMAGELGVNALTPSAFDPYSKQPELKHAAVQVEKVSAGHPVVAMRRIDLAHENPYDVMAMLREKLAALPYASLTLTGRETPVVMLQSRVDADEAALIETIDAAFSLDDPAHTLSYADSRRDIAKRARIDGDTLMAVRLVGETKAAEWLAQLMIVGASAAPMRRWLLAPVTQPPVGGPTRGKVICNCFDVSEDTIVAAFQAGDSLEQMQARTKCGTNCGSCIPELKRIAAQARPAA